MVMMMFIITVNIIIINVLSFWYYLDEDENDFTIFSSIMNIISSFCLANCKVSWIQWKITEVLQVYHQGKKF